MIMLIKKLIYQLFTKKVDLIVCFLLSTRRIWKFQQKSWYESVFFAFWCAYLKISFTDFYQLDNFFLPNQSSQQKIFFSKLHQIYAQVRDFLHFFTFQRSEMTISFLKKLKRDNFFFCVIIFFCNFLADYKVQKKKQLSQQQKKQLSTSEHSDFVLFWHKKRYINNGR